MFQKEDREQRKVVDGNNVLQDAFTPVQVLDVTVHPVKEGDGVWSFTCPSSWNPEGTCGFIAFRRLDGLLTLLNSRDVLQIDIGPLRGITKEDYEEGED
jgi:hypothetical protein